MSNEQEVSSAVKAALLKVAGSITSGLTREGYDDTLGYAAAVELLASTYVQLAEAGK